MEERFDQLASFDLGRFEQEYAEAPDIMAEILSIFTAQTPQRIEMLEEGLREQDPGRVATAAHSLANTTGTLMAERALTLARATEAAARAEDDELMAHRGRELLEEVRGILRQIHARRGQ
jgi:HPt (histidine-containing phosphotransfer) domain-containing protein